MKKTNKTKESRNVMKTTRDAVVAAAERIQLLKRKALELREEAGKKWDSTGPDRKKAKDTLKQAGRKIVDFEKDVREGLKQGLAEVKRRSKTGKK